MSTIALAALLLVKQQVKSSFYLILAVLQPVLFLLITAWLAGNEPPVMRDALASTTVMGMWSVTLFGAGRALTRERRFGTLELLLISPKPLLVPMLGVCLGAAALGIISAITGVVLVALLCGQVASPASVGLFVLALVPSVLCMAALGVLICGVFVMVRQAAVLTNVLEYPVWFACGLLVPLSDRTPVVAAIGDLLAPTQLGLLLRKALGTGQLDGAAATRALLLSLAYLALSIIVFTLMSRRVRRRGDLAAV